MTDGPSALLRVTGGQTDRPERCQSAGRVIAARIDDELTTKSVVNHSSSTTRQRGEARPGGPRGGPTDRGYDASHASICSAVNGDRRHGSQSRRTDGQKRSPSCGGSAGDVA